MTKTYMVIAGVNGAGKTTLFHSLHEFHDIAYVNVDSEVRKLGDWKDIGVVIKAGKMTIQQINEYIHSEQSFSQETTLCGKTIVKRIQQLKAKGYYIEMRYVGVECVEIAKERVHHRVEQGGHGISDVDIERRYYESFRNLKNVMEYCDRIYFYDNTEEFHLFAIYKGQTEIVNIPKVPNWFTTYIQAPKSIEEIEW